MEKIRNFSIIAHIDHGKSTLSDRFLEITGLIKKKENERILDTLELEQEKGITIKLQAAKMSYKDHTLNLIDTPGHVDFSYEVSRSLKACEGAILLVDASQGIQAQTLSTTRKARKLGLKIIPVLNKVDIEGVDILQRKLEITEMLGFDEQDILEASGKTGQGADTVLDKVISEIPPPKGETNQPLKALIFDSFYHEHKGVIVAIRVFEGEINKTQELQLIRSKKKFSPREIGFFKPNLTACENIETGDVGYIATGLKDIKLFTVGDTITNKSGVDPLPGYKPIKSKVFATLFPTDPDDFPELNDSLNKLSMNDAALTVKQRKSNLLGSGFRCGFLGMLHMQITQERLEREFDVSLIATSPTVEYQIKLTDGEIIKIQTAEEYPDPSQIQEIYEPWAKIEILTPQKHMGPVMELCQNARGEYKDTKYLTNSEIPALNYISIEYDIPLMSIITNFFDNLKSVTSGYASLDYDVTDYKPADIVKVSVLVNEDEVPALSFLEIRDKADPKSRRVLEALKETIPQHQFKIPLQAAIGGKIIAREDIRARRKDVTAKLYGGDVTRKKKLLEKQKKGKKKLREISNVNIPQKAFLAVLKT